jgi:hypothetical protein
VTVRASALCLHHEHRRTRVVPVNHPLRACNRLHCLLPWVYFLASGASAPWASAWLTATVGPMPLGPGGSSLACCRCLTPLDTTQLRPSSGANTWVWEVRLVASRRPHTYGTHCWHHANAAPLPWTNPPVVVSRTQPVQDHTVMPLFPQHPCQCSRVQLNHVSANQPCVLTCSLQSRW